MYSSCLNIISTNAVVWEGDGRKWITTIRDGWLAWFEAGGEARWAEVVLAGFFLSVVASRLWRVNNDSYGKKEMESLGTKNKFSPLLNQKSGERMRDIQKPWLCEISTFFLLLIVIWIEIHIQFLIPIQIQINIWILIDQSKAAQSTLISLWLSMIQSRGGSVWMLSSVAFGYLFVR